MRSSRSSSLRRWDEHSKPARKKHANGVLKDKNVLLSRELRRLFGALHEHACATRHKFARANSLWRSTILAAAICGLWMVRNKDQRPSLPPPGLKPRQEVHAEDVEIAEARSRHNP